MEERKDERWSKVKGYACKDEEEGRIKDKYYKDERRGTDKGWIRVG